MTSPVELYVICREFQGVSDVCRGSGCFVYYFMRLSPAPIGCQMVQIAGTPWYVHRSFVNRFAVSKGFQCGLNFFMQWKSLSKYRPRSIVIDEFFSAYKLLY